MTDRRRRLPAVSIPFATALLLALSLLPALVAPAAAASGPAIPPGIDTFMRALGQVESGGRYTARNPRTGAYGKYQILPSSWRAWARHYLHDAGASPTPQRQEIVAWARVTDLYRSFHDWGAVAHWWLTGRAPSDAGSRTASAGSYVRHVLAVYARYAATAAAPEATAPWTTTAGVMGVIVDDRAPQVTFAGVWSPLGGAGYVDGTATSSGDPAAVATLSFVGRTIEILAAVGPASGEARVVVDGGAPLTIDLQRAADRRSVSVFHAGWSDSGDHTISVEVVGTPGHPNVTLDAFIIGH